MMVVQAALTRRLTIVSGYCMALTRLSKDALCPNFAPLSMSSPARDVSCTVKELSLLRLNDLARNDALVWYDVVISRDATILGISFVTAAEDIDAAFTEVDLVKDECGCF